MTGNQNTDTDASEANIIRPTEPRAEPQKNNEDKENKKQSLKNHLDRFLYKPFKIFTSWAEAHNGAVTAAATVVIALATIVNVFYVGGQLEEMRSTSAQTDSIIGANRALAEAAKKSANVAEADQRPWVSVPKIKIEPDVGGDFRFTFVFKNVGKTATRGLYIVATIVPDFGWPNRLVELCASAVKAAQSPDFLFWSIVPNGEFPFSNSPSPGRYLDRVTKAELTSIKDPKIIGCVSYGEKTLKERIYHTGFVAPIEIDANNIGVAYRWGIDVE